MVLAVLPDNEFPESRFIKGGIRKKEKGEEDGAVGEGEEEGRRQEEEGRRKRWEGEGKPSSGFK